MDFNIVIQLWAWQIYTWWFGTRTCQSGNSGVLPSLPASSLVRFGFPVSNFERNSLVASTAGRFDRPYRVAICHGSLTIGVLTNVVVTRKAAPVRRKRRTLSALLAIASLRQVNDVKLATIIKLQCRPPAANYRGPHRY